MLRSFESWYRPQVFLVPEGIEIEQGSLGSMHLEMRDIELWLEQQIYLHLLR